MSTSASSGDVAAAVQAAVSGLGLDAEAFVHEINDALAEYLAIEEARALSQSRTKDLEWLAGLDAELAAITHRLRVRTIPPRVDAALETPAAAGLVDDWPELAKRLRVDIAAARRFAAGARVRLLRPVAKKGLLADPNGRPSLPHRDRMLWAVYRRIVRHARSAEKAREVTAAVLIALRIAVPENDRALQTAVANGKKLG